MEGEFKIYKGFLKRWVKYNYILSDNIITFSKNKNYVGKIHLKISNIVDKKNSNSFKICNGINTIKIKLKNLEVKNLLLNLIQKIKNNLLKKDLDKNNKIQLKKKLFDDYSLLRDDINLYIKSNSTKSLSYILKIFKNNLHSFKNELEKLFSKSNLDEFNKLNLISNDLENNSEQLLELFNKEKENLQILFKYVGEMNDDDLINEEEEIIKIEKTIPNKLVNDLSYNNNNIDINDFQSIVNNNSKLFLSINKTIKSRKKFFSKKIEINEKIWNLINNNPVFIKYPLIKENSRDNLPVLLPEKENYSILTILKNLIGKDLTNITLPVFMNEPLSFLQKIGENFNYFEEISKKILNTEIEELQMIYMLSISYMQYSHTVNKLKKPFNPLLGEIYHMELPNIKMKIIMEQISHHPPISAFYGENDDFIIEGYTHVYTNLSFKGFDVTPKGNFYITIKKTNTKYLTTKAKTFVHNYLFGKTYVWHSGDMYIENLKTNKKIVINLEKYSSKESNRKYIAKGVVKNDNNEIIYEIEGKWNKYLNVYDNIKKETIKIIEMEELCENQKGNYYMSKKTINFNLINDGILENICPNDSRLRPDQRALEYQDIELASKQKEKLEKNQIFRKKERELRKEKYEPKFFEKLDDEWIYKNNFFNHLENKDWGLLENIYENI